VGHLLQPPQGLPDPEIAYRAGETLRRLEKVPHAAVAAAAVRALGKIKPPQTAEVLLAYLPMADTDAVADEIRATLTAVAVRDGKAEPALVIALTDPSPVRRATAGVALIEGGPPAERVRIKDAYPAVRDAARAEKDPEARFQLLFAMLTVARDRDAVGLLIDALPDFPRGRLWQAEDYLIQLAGKDAPKAAFGKSKESLTKARDAWAGWWDKAKAGGANLDQFAYAPRIHGKTLLVMMDNRYGSMGAVIELGPDLKEKWKIVGLYSPMDARFTPDGDVAIAEMNSNRVTVRDTQGRVKFTYQTNGNGNNRAYGNPQQVQVLANGNLLVTCRNVVFEFAKGKDEVVMQYLRANTYDIAAAHRLPSGETVVLLQNAPDHTIFIDGKGKELADRKLKTGMSVYMSAHVVESGENRVLVTEQNQVAEYDLASGKKVWSKAAGQPRSVQRLPNGNTLYVEANANRLVEVTPDGEEVWTYQPMNGLQLFRGYRR
jgi:hypothetical protein